MADIFTLHAPELQLLRKEIEVQGDLLSQERIERKAEVDQLKLQVEALKKLLDKIQPGVLRQFEAIYEEERHTFDPEKGTSLKSRQK